MQKRLWFRLCDTEQEKKNEKVRAGLLLKLFFEVHRMNNVVRSCVTLTSQK